MYILKDEGYDFCIRGELRTFRGSVAFCSGDNLGSQLLGGYKQGSQSYRKCMGNSEELEAHVRTFAPAVNYINLYEPLTLKYIPFLFFSSMKISLFLEQKTVIMSNVKDLIGVNTFERPMDSTNLQF